MVYAEISYLFKQRIKKMGKSKYGNMDISHNSSKVKKCRVNLKFIRS